MKQETEVEQTADEADGKLGEKGTKRNKFDFALWKRSKEGEPTWDSPWGLGRPGWHIECSAMSGFVFGKKLDLHSGGQDLMFPHHDNEIAQTEACYQEKQWVNYFVHMGKLKIEGMKMSKTDKNYIKISEIIAKYSANTIRMFFATYKWDSEIHFSWEALEDSFEKDKRFNNFFSKLKFWVKENDLKRDLRFNSLDEELNKAINDAKQDVHNSLLDSLNTLSVMSTIDVLVTKMYQYEEKARKEKTLKLHVIYNGGRFIAKILKYIGFVYRTEFLDYFVMENEAEQQGNVEPFVDALVTFRSEIKKLALDKDFSAILQACDLLRDNQLVDLGVKVTDRSKNEKALWELKDKDLLRKELDDERANIEKKAAEKKKQKEEEEKKLSTPAKEWFMLMTDKYSAWDENGMPTHNSKGKEINEQALKKVKIDFDKHQKKHEEFIAKK